MDFLNANKAVYSSPNEGAIVIVDDQYVSKQSVELKVQDLSLKNKLVMLSNGQEACTFFEAALNDIQTSKPSAQRHVALLLIDINMPIMTGMQAVKIIRQKYEELNRIQREQGKEQVARPAILYFTQYTREQM